jgi:hypothetical protein
VDGPAPSAGFDSAAVRRRLVGLIGHRAFMWFGIEGILPDHGKAGAGWQASPPPSRTCKLPELDNR